MIMGKPLKGPPEGTTWNISYCLPVTDVWIMGNPLKGPQKVPRDCIGGNFVLSPCHRLPPYVLGLCGCSVVIFVDVSGLCKYIVFFFSSMCIFQRKTFIFIKSPVLKIARKRQIWSGFPLTLIDCVRLDSRVMVKPLTPGTMSTRQIKRMVWLHHFRWYLNQVASKVLQISVNHPPSA